MLVESTDYYCQGFQLRLKTNPMWFTTLDSRASGSKRKPVKVLLGKEDWTLTLDCAARVPAASSSIVADSITTDLGIVIAGSGVTFTLSGFNSPSERGPFEGDSGLVIWRYTFTSNKDFGSVAVT